MFVTKYYGVSVGNLLFTYRTVSLLLKYLITVTISEIISDYLFLSIW